MKNPELKIKCDQVKNYIGSGDIESAINTLMEIARIPSSGLNLNEVLTISFRYNSLIKEGDSGGLKGEEKRIVQSEIVQSILNKLKEINIVVTVEENSKEIKKNGEKLELINKELSKLNTKLSLNLEIAKERISRLGECWTKIYVFEKEFYSVLNEFIQTVVKEYTSPSLSEELSDKIKKFNIDTNTDNYLELNRNAEFRNWFAKIDLPEDKLTNFIKKLDKAFVKYKSADLVLEKTRFWLGEEFYDEARKYHNCYPTFLSDFKNKNYLGCTVCGQTLVDSKVSIDSHIKRLQENLFS